MSTNTHTSSKNAPTCGIFDKQQILANFSTWVRKDPSILDDRELVMEAMKKNGANYKHIPQSHPLKDDLEVLLVAIIMDKSNFSGWTGAVSAFNCQQPMSIQRAFSEVQLCNYMKEKFFEDENVQRACIAAARGEHSNDFKILRELCFMNIPLSSGITALLEKASAPIQFSALSGDDEELTGWFFTYDLKGLFGHQHPHLKGCDIHFGDFSICETETDEFLRQYILEENPQGFINYPEEDGGN